MWIILNLPLGALQRPLPARMACQSSVTRTVSRLSLEGGGREGRSWFWGHLCATTIGNRLWRRWGPLLHMGWAITTRGGCKTINGLRFTY